MDLKEIQQVWRRDIGKGEGNKVVNVKFEVISQQYPLALAGLASLS